MNKKAKVLISILLIIIIVLIAVIIILLKNKGTNDKEPNKDIKKAVGIYHNSNYGNQEATLQLNKDNTCIFPNSKDICEWTIKDDKIKITLTYYNIEVLLDSNDYLGLATFYYSLESCQDDLSKLDNEYKSPRCKAKSTTQEATLLNDGILLQDHKFNKIK